MAMAWVNLNEEPFEVIFESPYVVDGLDIPREGLAKHGDNTVWYLYKGKYNDLGSHQYIFWILSDEEVEIEKASYQYWMEIREKPEISNGALNRDQGKKDMYRWACRYASEVRYMGYR